MATLNLRHLYKVYPNGTKAVNDFNLDIKDQEFIVFVGPSGCGKSTTLRMIAGLEEISAGELYIDDKIVNYVAPKDRDIAMVFQNYALYPHLNVYENIAFGLRLRKLPKAEIDMKVKKAAEMLGLTEYLKTKPAALSGGQRQRVALGRALVREPKVFLLDEPLSNLDAKLRVFMRGEITKLHKKLKTTFIYVTHDQVEAMTMGDRIVVMKDGFIQQIDTPKNLYRYPTNKFVANFIGTPQMNFTDVTLKEEKEGVRMCVLNTNTTFLIPREYLLKVDPLYFDGETPISFAIRSEYLSRDAKQFPFSCQVKIVGVEELGTEIQLLTDFDINRDTLLLETSDEETIKSSLTIKTDADYDGKINDVINISLDIKNLHLFDSATEQVINPHIPNHSRVTGIIENHQLSIMGVKYKLPSIIDLEDGEYSVFIPIEAASINDKKGGFKVSSSELLEDNRCLVTFFNDGQVLFAISDKEYKKGDEVDVELSMHQLDFYRNKEMVFEHLCTENELDGMVYYHKEKDVHGKKKLVLDYLIDELELPCFNPVAYRTFIETKDRSIYDLDMVFKFSADQIYLDENGVFDLVVEKILDYGDNKYLITKYKEKKITVLLNNDIELSIGQTIKASIDVDGLKVFDSYKGIKLV